MPRIHTSSSTPETRRRELLLLKSSSIDGRIQSAFDEAKVVVRKSIEDEEKLRLSAEQKEKLAQSHARVMSDEIDDLVYHHTSGSSMGDESMGQTKLSSASSSSIYHVQLAADDEDDDQPHFITCVNIEPNYTFIPITQLHRRRTSSLPSSSIVVHLCQPTLETNHRSASLVDLTKWQNHPQRVIDLFDRQYHSQPIAKLDDHRFLLASSTQIDIYHIETGQCNEKICFQSSSMNYIGLCYNQWKDELLAASTTDLYIYDLPRRAVHYQIRLPGFPFNLDSNHHIRYLACNSSSIYHGYFSFTSTGTSTVLSRLSQYQLQHVCDLEFDDGTLHGLHAFEQYVGIIIRYGRYSSKRNEEYSLYIYDSPLNEQYYHLDLKDIGYISCLTGYERTLDWILCDTKKQRLIFVNQESIEYVQYDEPLQQCVMFDEWNYFAVWVNHRILFYAVE